MNRTLILDSERFQKDRFSIVFFVIFWLVWTPVTLVMTVVAIAVGLSLIWLWVAFAWIAVVLIPISMMRMDNRLKLIDEGATVRITGLGIFGKGEKSLVKRDVSRVQLANINEESVPTIEIVTLDKFSIGRSVRLTTWADADGKRVMLQEVGTFLRSIGCEFEMRDETSR